MQSRPQSGKYTVDRFELDKAVLLYRLNETIELVVPRSVLPLDITEGSILELELKDSEIKTVSHLNEETESIRKSNDELLQQLIKKTP